MLPLSFYQENVYNLKIMYYLLGCLKNCCSHNNYKKTMFSIKMDDGRYSLGDVQRMSLDGDESTFNDHLARGIWEAFPPVFSYYLVEVYLYNECTFVFLFLFNQIIKLL